MKYKQTTYLLILCLFLASCIPSREIENLGIINTRGVDNIEGDKIETTLAIFQFEGQSNEISKTVFGKGNTLKGAMVNANLESNFKLTAEKTQLELYGLKTAKDGILPYIDTLNRDASLPDTTYLAISNTTAKELLTIEKEDITMDTSQYLHGLIEENSTDHLFPRVTFQEFLTNFYDIGKDPYLPLFDLQDNIPKLASIAIMQDDKYVGKLSADNIIYFNLIMDKIKDKRFELSLPMKPFVKYIEKSANIKQRDDVLHTAYNIIKGKSKTTLIDKENLVFQTKIDLRLNLFEMSEKILIKDKKVIKLLEKEIEKEIASHYEKLLAQLQEVNSDPFAYGTVYRINKKDSILKRTEWREKYPKIDVRFKVDANVITHGSVD